MQMKTILDHLIDMKSGVRGGKPCLAGTRVTVDDVVMLHLRLGQGLEEIAGNFDLPFASIHAAMAYYYEHRAEIDQRLEADEVYVEAFRRSNPSPLQEKLRRMSAAA